MAVGLVFSRPGVGSKCGGQHVGTPISVGPTTTAFRRHDGIKMRLPNEDMLLWSGPFDAAGRSHGIRILARHPGWEWLRWTLADHVAADYQRTTAENTDVAVIYPPAEAGPLVIVPCGARKRDRPAAAKNLYLGSYQQLCLRAAYAITAPANIRILSGRHGLLELDTVIEPYNLRIGDPGSVTAADIADQAAATGIIAEPAVVALAGKDYARLVVATWPHARTPLAGSRGIGVQQHRLARIAAVGPSALSDFAQD